MKDTFYFRHDCNARQDENILALRMRHKWAGYGLFWAIVERLRESKNYECVKDYNLIAFDLQADAGLIKSIINDFGLFAFTEDGKRFYSERLKKDMIAKDEISAIRSRAGKKGLEKRWGNTENKKADTQQVQNNEEDNIKEDDSKSIANAKQMHNKAIAIKEDNIKEDIEEKDIPKGISKKKDATNVATLEQRAKKFYDSLRVYLDIYPKEMVRAFYDYWTEPNKSATKMRFELEKTWETSRRLATWASREKVKTINNGEDKYQKKLRDSQQRKLATMANLNWVRQAAEKRRAELEAEGVI